jgi:hypothetical protein
LLTFYPGWPPTAILISEVAGTIGQVVHETLSRKYPTQKKDGGVTQVVELLPSKREALGLKKKAPDIGKTK